MYRDNYFEGYVKNSNQFDFLPNEFKISKSDSNLPCEFSLNRLSVKLCDDKFFPENTHFFIGATSPEGLVELEHIGFELTDPFSFGKLPAITLNGLRDNSPLFNKDSLGLVGRFHPIIMDIDYPQGRRVYGRDENQKGLIYVTGDLANQEFTQPQYETIHGVSIEDIRRFPGQLDSRYDLGAANKRVRVDQNPVPKVDIWYRQ